MLVSGGGTNLQAVLDSCGSGHLASDPAVEVVAVISNRAEAYGLERARLAEVPAVVVGREGRDRAPYCEALADVVSSYQPDLVVLAGWMRILTAAFLDQFPVINLHPALPGTFPGTDAIERAFAQFGETGFQVTGFQETGSQEGESLDPGFQETELLGSGVMVHWVPDEGVDVGPVIVQEPVLFVENDTLEHFEERMHLVEHRLLIDGIRLALASTENPCEAQATGQQ